MPSYTKQLQKYLRILAKVYRCLRKDICPSITSIYFSFEKNNIILK